MISVPADKDLEALRKAVARGGMTWPRIGDGKGAETPDARLYGAGVGTHYVIGRDGRIAGMHQGSQGAPRMAPLVETLPAAPPAP